MRPDVLITLAEGRAKLEMAKKGPPYAVFYPPKRMMRLCRELHEMKVPFGIPFLGDIPDPTDREDGHQWIYFGTVLGDVHVFGRAR